MVRAVVTELTPSLTCRVAEYSCGASWHDAPTYAVITPFVFFNPAIVSPGGTPVACTERVPAATAESETTAMGMRDTVPSAETGSGPCADIPGGGFRIARSYAVTWAQSFTSTANTKKGKEPDCVGVPDSVPCVNVM